MKRTPKKAADPEMREEYDFSGGVRGKHAPRDEKGTNVVLLDPGLSELFPDSKAVNDLTFAVRPVG